LVFASASAASTRSGAGFEASTSSLVVRPSIPSFATVAQWRSIVALLAPMNRETANTGPNDQNDHQRLGALTVLRVVRLGGLCPAQLACA